MLKKNVHQPISKDASDPQPDAANPDDIGLGVVGISAEAHSPAAPPTQEPPPLLRRAVAGEAAAVPVNTCCGGELSAPHTAGPFIKFWGLKLGQPAEVEEEEGPPRVWLGSLLLVTRALPSEVAVQLQDGPGGPPLQPPQLEGPEEIDRFGGWVALRYRLRVPVGAEQRLVRYRVVVGGHELRPGGGAGEGGGEGYSFHVAGKTQPTHWGFYSCSGFTPDVPLQDREGKWAGITPLWEDIRKVHDKSPLHLLVGGGDQLYCDDVWSLPSLQRFLALPNQTEEERQAKRQAPYGSDMAAEVEAYYFHHYAHHFSRPHIGDVYALVPQVMSWDDHDIFDGWGSYLPYLQESAVFRGVFESALRWYCVFQQHCTPKEKKPVAVYEIGSRTAIVACDMRHQRRPHEIIPLEHYMEISLLGRELPKDIEHLVFVSTVPVVYPHVRGARSLMQLMRNGLLQCLLGGCGSKVLNQFGEPELMDDLDDHWSAPDHREERRFLVEHLQMLSKFRGLRVTLLSGDVHVAGAGYLVSGPAPRSEEQLINDFRYMPQVISSAIGNAPPPGVLVKLLECFGGGGRINRDTRYRMMGLIRNKLGVRKPLDNKRNWCEVLERQASQGSHLTFRLRIEDTPGSIETVKLYDIDVPPLKPCTPGTDMYYDGRSRAEGGWGGCLGANAI